MEELTTTAWDTAIDLHFDGAIADCGRLRMGTDAETVEIECDDGTILEVVSFMHEGEEVYTVDTYANRGARADGEVDAQGGGPISEMYETLQGIARDHYV